MTTTTERGPDERAPQVRGPLTGPAAVVPAVGVGVLIATVYGLWSWRQWERFEVPSWDLGIFTQIARGWSQWQLPVVDIKGPGFMILGDHFHPLLALLAPVYWIHPSGLSLLLAQAALIGLSAVIVTACAIRHLGRGSGVALGLAYGLSWGLASAVASQFHEVALALPFLAASLAALVRRDLRAAALWSLPLLLVKEDLGLTVAAIGVVIAIRAPAEGRASGATATRGRGTSSLVSGRRLGLALAGVGVVAFVVTTQVILPALNPDGVWDYADDSIVSQLLADPGGALAGLFTGAGQKLVLILLVFGITGFLALRSPLALITLPTFAWRLTSDVPFHWSTDWHYSAVLMPIVFLATVDALISSPRWRSWAPFATGFALVASLIVATQFPLAKLAESEYWGPGSRVEGASAALAAIPDDAVVVSDITLMAYLAPRAEVYWIGNDNPVPDYVVLYSGSGIYDAPPTDAAVWAEDRFPGEDFTQIVDQDGFLVAEHVP